MENSTDNKFFTKTFFWMFLGLIGTAIVAAYTYYSGLWIKLALSGSIGIVAIVELVAVLLFTFLFKKMSPTVAGIVFFVYAGLNGITLSSIFALYELNSIVIIFCATALLFGVLAFIGYKTNKDLSNWRTVLMPTLLIGIVVSIINLFLKSSMLDIGLCWFILLLFFGITVYDMNKLKMLSEDSELNQDKLYIYGALELYLDFINIFLRLLRLFAKLKD